MSDVISDLKSSKIFAKLTDKKLAVIAKKITIKDCDPEESILKMKQNSSAFFIILHGAAKIYITDRNDHKKVLAILKAGDFFGEISLFTGSECTAFVETFGHTKLAIINKEDMVDFISKYPEISYEIIQSLCMRIIDTDKLVEDITFKNLVGRLAAKLLDLADKFGKETEKGIMVIDMDLTHQSLAEMVGTNRETVTKIITFFKEDDAISFEDKRLKILNMDYIKKFSY
jgi:CRP/FNR family transcriptional regulator